MKIAVIGAGNQGSALGGALTKAGHDVVYGVPRPSPDPGSTPGPQLSVEEAVRRADLLALTVPAWHLTEALETIRRAGPGGKIVVDVTNPLTAEKAWARGFSSSNAEEVRDALPGARVVKAFNTVFAGWLRAGGRAFGEQLSALVASDDVEAKRVVLGLAREIGLDPVDAGQLDAARLLEAAGVMLVRFGAFTDLGWDIGVRLVHPPAGA